MAGDEVGEHRVESDDEPESSETTPCALSREWGKCGATSLHKPSAHSRTHAHVRAAITRARTCAHRRVTHTHN